MPELVKVIPSIGVKPRYKDESQFGLDWFGEELENEHIQAARHRLAPQSIHVFRSLRRAPIVGRVQKAFFFDLPRGSGEEQETPLELAGERGIINTSEKASRSNFRLADDCENEVKENALRSK